MPRGRWEPQGPVALTGAALVFSDSAEVQLQGLSVRLRSQRRLRAAGAEGHRPMRRRHGLELLRSQRCGQQGLLGRGHRLQPW